MSKRSEKGDIWIVSVAEGELVRFTEESDNSWPSCSPDGSRIAFVSDRDGHSEIYIMNADGTNQTRLTYTSGRATNPAWKPISILPPMKDCVLGEANMKSGNKKLAIMNYHKSLVLNPDTDNAKKMLEQLQK